MSEPSHVGIVVLAAGESKRLGLPKQLLPFCGITLIAHLVQTAIASRAAQTIVVTGAHADQIRLELDCLKATLVENVAWNEGMATSIRRGIETLEESEKSHQAVLIMTSDQPRVSTQLIDLIIEKYDNQVNRIVACEYEETVGVPALFDQAYFHELKSLSGDGGARGIIRSHLDRVVTLPFPEGGLDIDTAGDAEKL